MQQGRHLTTNYEDTGTCTSAEQVRPLRCPYLDSDVVSGRCVGNTTRGRGVKEKRERERERERGKRLANEKGKE